MTNRIIISIYLCFLSLSTHANSADTLKVPKVNAFNFQNTFDKIVKESNSFKEFKLIKSSDLDIIKTAHSVDLAEYKSTIIALQENLNKLNDHVEVLKTDKANLKAENVSFLTTSSNSNTKFYILAGLGIFFLLLSIFFYLKYKKNKVVYRDQKDKLQICEDDFEIFKRSAMERELKLKREIMDEKNKNNRLEIVDKNLKKGKA